MRWSILLLFALTTACSTTRVFTINTQPPGSAVKVNGRDAGVSPLTREVVFNMGGDDVCNVTASHLGFKEGTLRLTKDSPDQVNIELKPETRRIQINVEPFPALVSIDGKLVSPEPVRSVARDLEMTVDAENRWVGHRITAEHPGREKVEKVVSGADSAGVFTLELPPKRKDITIRTTPPKAKIFLDGEELGESPLTTQSIAFTTDPSGKEWDSRTLKIVRPGFDPIEQKISWDEGKSEYAFDLRAKSKTVKIVTIPAGAAINIDGKDYPADDKGIVSATLTFDPIDDQGTLRTYTATATKKTADSEWEPAKLPIGWDAGKPDYAITLKEIRTTEVELLVPEFTRTDNGWQVSPKIVKTIARKDVNEGIAKVQPQKLTNLPKGTQIDTLAVSPDGAKLVFVTLFKNADGELRSSLKMINTDGTGGVQDITDGRSLDLHPAFTPDGKEIVYSSNRGGKRMAVWKLSANGEPGIKQLAADETTNLWPCVDAENRLFYQGLVDNRPDARLYMSEMGKMGRTDLLGGLQPRISPDGTTLLFAVINDKTSKRDIYSTKMKDLPVSVTDSPGSDSFDASWSHDGSKIAFVSDRGADEDKRHNFDVWVMDAARTKEPTQLTSNGSWDDCPVFGRPKADAIYFRSNRGGQWAVWKMVLP